MVGNAKFIKHSSIVPQCAIAVQKIFFEVEASILLFTNLLISGRKASQLVFNKRIKGISLTGCEIAISSIATKSDNYFKKNVLELGGSDTFIVLNDADTDKALE